MRPLSLFFLAALLIPAQAARPAEAQARSPYTETIPGGLVKFEMVPIPAGEITLPDPKAPGKTRAVQVKPLWMGKTEVTWDVFDIYAFRLDQTEQDKAQGVDAASRPSRPYGAPDHGFGHQGYAALSMTYHSAEQFCRWLSAKTGKKYRLPTEAEWEYAARAGKTGAAARAAKDLESIAWFWDNADDKAQPVGRKQANAWGLHDLLGNAAEWCTGLDGTPVVRGGSWRDKAAQVHPGARAVQTPEWNQSDPQDPKSRWWLSDGSFVGFRVVREE